MRNLARGIGSDARWATVPHQNFVHIAWGDSGALERRLDCYSAQLGCVNVLESASKSSDRGPGGPQNHYVAHGHRVPIISNDCSN